MSKICLFDVRETMLSMGHEMRTHLQEFEKCSETLFFHK